MSTLFPLFTGDTSSVCTRKASPPSNGTHIPGPTSVVTIKDSFLELSGAIYDPLFPAEHAYTNLLTLLESFTPWKVTPELLFRICHVLEKCLPCSQDPACGPSHHSLLPVLRTMRTWRLMERRNLESLASALAGIVNSDLWLLNDDDESNAVRGAHRWSGKMENKENIPADLGGTSGLCVYIKEPKWGQHVPSLSHLLGDPLPSFRHQCVACAALRSVSKSDATLQNVRRALHHTHDSDGLAFPRPPSSSSKLNSRSRSNFRTSFVPESPTRINSWREAVHTYTSPPRLAFAQLNGEPWPRSWVTPDRNFSNHLPMFHVEDEMEFCLGEIWKKRRSQEEGWRL